MLGLGRSLPEGLSADRRSGGSPRPYLDSSKDKVLTACVPYSDRVPPASSTLIGAEDKEEESSYLFGICYMPRVILNDSDRLGALSRTTQKSDQDSNPSLLHTLHYDTPRELFTCVRTARTALSVSSLLQGKRPLTSGDMVLCSPPSRPFSSGHVPIRHCPS